MNLEYINTFFERIGRWQINHRIALLVGIVIVSALGFAGLPRLKTSTGAEDWFDNSESIHRETERFEQLFGNEETVAILVKTHDVFDPVVLEAIQRVGDEMLEKVPYAKDITSLTSLEVTSGTDEGLEIVNPFGEGIPADHAEIERARALILSKDSLRNRMVSDDCTETWIVLSLHPYPGSDELAEGETDPMYIVGAEARKILEDPKWRNDLYEFLPIGMPYTESEELEVVTREASLRIIAGFVVMVICLLVFLRSLRGLLIPIFTTIAGISVVFGGMGWFGIKADATLMSLPVILGMALSVGYSMHLFNAVKGLLRGSGNRKESAVAAVAETGWPILFTASTTIAGLISFLFADIGPLRWLGLTCSLVVLSVYLYTFILVPTLMSFGRDHAPRQARSGKPRTRGATAVDESFASFGKGLLKHATPVLIACLVIIAFFIPGLGKSEVNMDYFQMMGLKIPYIQRVERVVNSKLGSYLDYNVMITYPDADAAKSPEVMHRLDEFATKLGNLSMTKRTGNTAKVSSVLDIVKEMNKTLNADSSAHYSIPDDPDMLSQILFLYEISGGSRMTEWITEDYASLRVKVDITRYDADNIVKDIAEIRRSGAELFPGATVSVIGSAAEFAEMNRKIVIGQLKSFAGAFVIIAIMMIIAFGSVITGLIAMIPNVAPVIVVGGLLGHLGWTLDMMTMTIMPMILGIAVDDTIHFSNHVKLELECGSSLKEAIVTTFRSVGKAIFMTTTILCATFAMYIFSPMNTMFKIGVLASVGLATALIADYTLTPVLLYIMHPIRVRRDCAKELNTEEEAV